MPRAEKPITSTSGALAEFAECLRALRQAAGGIPYRTMAGSAHYSATVLSRAAAGQLVPTWPAVRAYVGVCGGNEAEWQQRWDALHSCPGDGDEPAAPSAAVRTPRRVGPVS
jgi:hypothetical protein